MERRTGIAGGFCAAAGGNGAWRLLGPGGGGAQFVPAFSPHDPKNILVACDMTGAYETHDGGETWAEFNLGSVVHCFAFDPVDPGVVYAGADGLFRSTDGGKAWRLVYPDPACVTGEQLLGDHAERSFVSRGNWPGGEIQIIRVDEADNRNIYLGIFADHKLFLYYSGDHGASWRELACAEGSRFHAIFLEPVSCGVNRCLHFFTDKEACTIHLYQNTLPVKQNLPDGLISIAHASCGTNPETVASEFYLIASQCNEAAKETKTALWKSGDRGRTWRKLPVRLDGNAPAFGDAPELSLLAVPEKDCRTVYAGVSRCTEFGVDTGAGSVHAYFGVIKREDYGETWQWVLKSDYAVDPPNLQTGWAERDYGLPWYLTGPKGVGPIGLGVCPSDPDICCITDLSSTFLTTDGGKFWRQIYSTDNPDGTVSSRGLEVTTCYGVHFDSFDRNHIAVSYTDIGMFHSPDGGHSWRHSIAGVPVTWGNTCYWVEFDPEIKERSWSAWGGAHDLPRPKMFRSGGFHLYEGGICKSDDGMASWCLSNSGMPGNCVVTHLVLDPASHPDSRTLYAAGFDKGVYKSVDDGASWILCNGGISGNLNAWRLTLLPDGTLFLLVARGLRGPDIIDGAFYKSTDGAEHWERVLLPPGVNAPNDLVFDPANPNVLYLSCWPVETGGTGLNGGLFSSQDGGLSWRNLFDQSAHVYAAAVHPQNPAVLFVVTFDSAAWYSEDVGNTWIQIKGYDFKWGHRPIVDPADGGMLYITTFGNSVWHGPWKS